LFKTSHLLECNVSFHTVRLQRWYAHFTDIFRDMDLFRLLWVTSVRYLNKLHGVIYTVAGYSYVIHSPYLTLCDVNMQRYIIIYRSKKENKPLWRFC